MLPEYIFRLYVGHLNSGKALIDIENSRRDAGKSDAKSENPKKSIKNVIRCHLH